MSIHLLAPPQSGSSSSKCPVPLSCFSEGRPSGDFAWSWGGDQRNRQPRSCGGDGVPSPRGGRGEGRGRSSGGSLTRVAHRGMQQVHARSGQAQPIDCVRRLLKIRHHAKVVRRRKVGPNRGNPAGRSRFSGSGQIQVPWWVGLEWWN